MIAFVFPGQGAQAVGMGVDLAGRWPAARRVFDEASAAVGFDVLALCREGPAERLQETENTQPALLTASWAAAAVLLEEGVVPDLAAGLSLGEYGALVAAGALAFRDAVAVARQRGRFMQEAARGRATAMAAVLGLQAEHVDAVCAGVRRETGGLVEAANFNAPGQVVIGGDTAAVEAAAARLKAAGARRIIPLAVGGPFHTSLMEPAAQRLAEVLATVPLRPARVPVVANVHARPVRDPDEIRAALVAQVAAPVRWEASVRTLRDLGATVFVEVGPGTTLAGMIRKTVPGADVLPAGDVRTVTAAATRLRGPAARADAGR